MKKILLYNSGGGLGDSIQLFTLILSLQKHYKDSDFFYLGAHENHFQGKLKEFGIKISTFEIGFKYFGFRWWHFFAVKKNFLAKNFKKLDLIIDLQSKLRNTIILKKIPHHHFYSSTFNFKFCSRKGEYTSKDFLKNLNEFLDINLQISNFKKFQNDTGWKPKITFEKTMEDLLNYWREKITNGGKFLDR